MKYVIGKFDAERKQHEAYGMWVAPVVSRREYLVMATGTNGRSYPKHGRVSFVDSNDWQKGILGSYIGDDSAIDQNVIYRWMANDLKVVGTTPYATSYEGFSMLGPEKKLFVLQSSPENEEVAPDNSTMIASMTYMLSQIGLLRLGSVAISWPWAIEACRIALAWADKNLDDRFSVYLPEPIVSKAEAEEMWAAECVTRGWDTAEKSLYAVFDTIPLRMPEVEWCIRRTALFHETVLNYGTFAWSLVTDLSGKIDSGEV